jgi:hypothetical protein
MLYSSSSLLGHNLTEDLIGMNMKTARSGILEQIYTARSRR